MISTKKLVATFAIAAAAALGSQAASATCGLTYSAGTDGRTVVSGSPCGSPSPTPVQPTTTIAPVISPVIAPVVNTTAAAQAAALAQQSQTQYATSTIAPGAVVANPSATSTIAPGAVVANPSATSTTAPVDIKTAAINEGNTVNIKYPEIKQATHMNVANAPGTVAGCVAQSGFSITLSAVGAGALGTSFTTGAEMVPGCTQGDMDKSIVVQGIASDDPAKTVLAVVVAGHVKALDEVTEARMSLFGRQNRAPASQGSVALNQHFYGEKQLLHSHNSFVTMLTKKLVL